MARLPRDSRTRAAVLVVTVIVVAAGVTAAPALLDVADEPAETPEYAVGALVPEAAPSDGEISIEPREDGGVVLVDLAHRNRMEQAEIAPLLEAITDAGYRVDLLERRESLDDALARADAFVVIDPSASYSDEEAGRVEAFVDRGGRLLLIGEPTTLDLTGFALIERTNQLTTLSNRFGLEFGEAHLYNMQEYDGNHLNVFAEPAGSDRLTQGISRAAFYTATRITVNRGEPVLVATDRTRSARNDATGRYAIAAVNGDVLAIADGTFLRRGNFNVVDNERLVENVVDFLVSGDKEVWVGAYPTYISQEPTIHYTGPPLLDAAQDLAVSLRASGRDPTMALHRDAVSPDDTDILVTSFDYLDRHGQLGTGVRVSGDQVAVNGYNSEWTGVMIVRAPARGYELVVVTDSPIRAQRAVGRLIDGTLRLHLLTDRTVVIRTGAATTPEE